MGNSAENSLREEQLASQGRLLSSFSHELRNHLAVIIESKGLLHDYLEMGIIADQDLTAKIEKIIKLFNERTVEITSMVQHLNSFSHRSDTPTSTFDLNSFIIEQLFFLQRLARLKKIPLKIHLPSSDIQINNNPALLQFIFQLLFEAALQQLRENDEMAVSIQHEKGEAHIQLTLKSYSHLGSTIESLLERPEFKLTLDKIKAQIIPDLSSSTSHTFPQH